MAIARILVANRGEIAVRILQTCRMLGIETVLAVSTADRDSLGARLADRTVCIGPARAADSYLRTGAIVEAALRTGADAVHPGYGFLSENPALARECASHGIVFIGPTAQQIAAVGDKLEARKIAKRVGVPVLPGGEADSSAAAARLAGEIGFPLLVKAVAGGGGRGMKQVARAEELDGVLTLAMAEANAAFGDDRVYLERFVEKGRHVEVQLLGDGERLIHLGDRDCSVQRRYQKLIEEAPAPGLSGRLRADLQDAALRFAGSIGYRSLGTVEFLVDAERETFYFLEMNARIQVEHPVTEAITGLDLVALQIAIAGGAPLSLAQADVRFSGHAVECRLNAEDPRRDFLPNAGTIGEFWFPSATGIRVDTALQPGMSVPPFYDSMIAKVIAHGSSRGESVARMQAALRATHITGIVTNIDLHRRIVADPEFRAGGMDTGYLGRFLQSAKTRPDGVAGGEVVSH